MSNAEATLPEMPGTANDEVPYSTMPNVMGDKTPEVAPEQSPALPEVAKNGRAPSVSRTLKSTKTDLKIIVGPYDNDDKGKPQELLYQCTTMADHSNYISKKLESMKEEGLRAPFIIDFKEISANQWDLMMKFLEPVEARHMTAGNVLLVAEYFDRFDFTRGRRLCDMVLQEYFLSEKANEEGMDVELLVDSLAVAYRAHLLGSYEIGQQFIKDKLLQAKECLVNHSTATSEPKKVHSKLLARFRMSLLGKPTSG